VTQTATEGSPLSVLIVDSDELVRESLAGLLEIGRRCVVVACAGAPDEALELIAACEPDVVLLDPRLPEVDAGRALLTTIREEWPSVRIVVLGASDALDRSGHVPIADAYVRKTFRPSELLRAIDAAIGSPSREDNAARPSTGRSQHW
jgi:DNA-binding NarL/FixJ family response regulator